MSRQVRCCTKCGVYCYNNYYFVGEETISQILCPECVVRLIDEGEKVIRDRAGI